MSEMYHVTINGERATVLVYGDSPFAPDVLEKIIEGAAENLAQEQYGEGGTFTTVGPRAFAYTSQAEQ